jgi:L-ribulose-5-phosphate 3-epimerase
MRQGLERCTDMLGIMQGRLSEPLPGGIQEFPINTWEKEFELANSLGIKVIEWTLAYKDLKINPIFDIKNYNKFKALQKKHAIQIPSLALNCFVEAPFYKRNELTGLESNVSDLIWIVDRLIHTEVKILVLPIVAECGVFNENCLSKLISCLKSVEQILESANIKIAIECEFNIKFMVILLSKLNPSIFGVNFDMGNSAALGNNPEEELFVCKDRILNVHIKDRLLSGKSVKLGDGAVDFSTVANLLIDQKYKGNMILEAARSLDKNEFELTSSYLNFCEKLGWVEGLSGN